MPMLFYLATEKVIEVVVNESPTCIKELTRFNGRANLSFLKISLIHRLLKQNPC